MRTRLRWALTAALAFSGGCIPSQVTPEYNRQLKKVLISLPVCGSSLADHHELLSRMPEYSQILLLAPKAGVPNIRAELAGKPYGHRVRLVPYDPRLRKDLCYYFVFRDKSQLMVTDSSAGKGAGQLDTVWAQDLFEVATGPSGRPVLLVPSVYKYFTAIAGSRDHRLVPDNACLGTLRQEGLEVQRLSVAFRGGNVMVDEINGRRIVLVGSDTLRTTQAGSHAFAGPCYTGLAAIARLKRAFNADRVVVVGGLRLQPEKMFHLDQELLLLRGGRAAVARIVGGLPQAATEAEKVADARRFLAELRQVLVRLGYRIVDIETSVQNVLRFEHYVNAIPYVDAESGRPTILMPVFPSARTESDMRLIRRNSQALRSLGYDVVQVPTQAHRLHGGIHCLANVLQ